METLEARPKTLEEVEREAILSTLEAFNGDKLRTCVALGICLKTLYLKLNKYGYPMRRKRKAGS
jgi:DNA-binding NtrC family response regulator